MDQSSDIEKDYNSADAAIDLKFLDVSSLLVILSFPSFGLWFTFILMHEVFSRYLMFSKV